MKIKRTDIQFLRGVSVLLVIIFHAFDGVVNNGFLGVDIFFVISGFLVTGMILRDLENETFSFWDFYARRARRLIPATISTLILSTILALLVLSRSQLQEYGEQLIGSVFFYANFVLAFQSGYFETASSTKPLLHMWSLSLEEQFYIIFPILLYFSPRKIRIKMLFAIFFLSFLLNILLVAGPSWVPFTAAGAQKLAFYMLPTRAWELAAGGIASWAMMRWPGLTVPAVAKYAALAAIGYSCAAGVDAVHPRGDAFVVVASTCLILLGNGEWLQKSLIIRQISIIGDLSYSLYLLHWPILSFSFIIFDGAPPIYVTISIIIATFIAAYIQYRYVEIPFRGIESRAGVISIRAMLVSACGLAAIGIFFANLNSGIDVRPTSGLAATCDQKLGSWKDLPACRSASSPQVAVWGDSYAMHLIPGLAGVPLIQMTRSACAPILGIAQLGGKYTENWAEGCIHFNRDVFDSIKQNSSIKIVFIGSQFSSILDFEGKYVLFRGKKIPWSEDIGRETMLDTLDELKAAGKTPIIIAPTPSAGFNAGLCNERLEEGRLMLGRKGCDLSRKEAEARSHAIGDKLGEIARQAGVRILDPANVLCDGDICRTRTGASILYSDGGHLTHAGSAYVAEGLGLRGIAGRW